MTPNDIPTTITRLVHAAIGERLGGPLGLSTKDAADLLAHFWPAIEAHIREQVAQEIEQQVRTWEGMSDQASERARGMSAAISIARKQAGQ